MSSRFLEASKLGKARFKSLSKILCVGFIIYSDFSSIPNLAWKHAKGDIIFPHNILLLFEMQIISELCLEIYCNSFISTCKTTGNRDLSHHLLIFLALEMKEIFWGPLENSQATGMAESPFSDSVCYLRILSLIFPPNGGAIWLTGLHEKHV